MKRGKIVFGKYPLSCKVEDIFIPASQRGNKELVDAINKHCEELNVKVLAQSKEVIIGEDAYYVAMYADLKES